MQRTEGDIRYTRSVMIIVLVLKAPPHTRTHVSSLIPGTRYNVYQVAGARYGRAEALMLDCFIVPVCRVVCPVNSTGKLSVPARQMTKEAHGRGRTCFAPCPPNSSDDLYKEQFGYGGELIPVAYQYKSCEYAIAN